MMHDAYSGEQKKVFSDMEFRVQLRPVLYCLPPTLMQKWHKKSEIYASSEGFSASILWFYKWKDFMNEDKVVWVGKCLCC